MSDTGVKALNSYQENRCRWVEDALLADYHDNEWGQMPTTDARWFEFVTLETFQAGLSWRTILHKREAFRQAFQGFEPARVAAFGESEIKDLMNDEGIVRNRKKIEAAVANARIAVSLQAQCGSLHGFFTSLHDLKTQDLYRVLQQTFRFVGKTTAESIAFATGLQPAPHDAGCIKSR